MKNVLTAIFVIVAAVFSAKAETAGNTNDDQSLLVIKKYLVDNLQKMNVAAQDFVTNATAYQAIIDAADGDYDKAASEHGVELGELVKKMQGDFGRYHNHGYETIEGIVAGTKKMVYFDNYLDGGVPASEASTDSPQSPLVLKARDGKMISVTMKKKVVPEMLKAIHARVPWAIFGYSVDLLKTWQKSRDTMITAVDTRREQAAQ